MNWIFSGKNIGILVAGLVVAATTTVRAALFMTPTLLTVSHGVLTPGEWSDNFGGAISVANEYNIPLLVFYGGLSCGKCEELQRACLTDEFLAWQQQHKMLMVFTTNNSLGDASAFSKPQDSTGFPFIAVYWNKDGNAPQRDTELYRTFNGRDGEMLVKGGTLADQLIGSIEAVVGSYDFSSVPDISERAEILYSEPVTTKTRYDLRLFTGINASAALSPQKVYNLSASVKPVIKKVSGVLPTGMKLFFADGAVVLSGVAKQAGTYQYAFSIQQRRNGVLHEGPTIEFNFTVIAANDASQGGCAMLGQAIKATVPLFADESAGKAMRGVLELTASARNKVKAHYIGLSSGKTTFSGEWSEIEGGTARATLAARGMNLALEMGGDGTFKAVLSGSDMPVPIESLDGLRVGAGAFAAAFSGSYTVSLAETSPQSGTGCGYLFIKNITPAGKVQWNGMLGNGQTVSGSAFAMVDSTGCGTVAVFKNAKKDYIAAALKICSENPAAKDLRAVVACGGTVPRWAHYVAPAAVHDCAVRGSWYSKDLALDECCMAQFFGTTLELSAVTDGFSSEELGAVTSTPKADVTVTSDNLSLVGRLPDVNLKFSKANGTFKGSMNVTFASGVKTVKFAGVAIPGWHDCGCAPVDASDPFHIDESQPFAIGAAWFADKEDGVATSRGFMLKIDGKGF